MNTDIYDSMAEGVQGAACVICFMSPAYQESANCKLELKFAQQSGVPIVPVMVQAEWRASDWLGAVLSFVDGKTRCCSRMPVAGGVPLLTFVVVGCVAHR
jgi:hypothetical protein